MPEPILISISAALAARAVVGLVDLVRKKFAKDPAATAALEAAQAAPEDPEAVQALAEQLDVTEKSDEEFATALRAEWEKASVTQQAKGGKVVNQISGNVSGKVLQAGDIHGDISF
jgi:hypothetical protein